MGGVCDFLRVVRYAEGRYENKGWYVTRKGGTHLKGGTFIVEVCVLSTVGTVVFSDVEYRAQSFPCVR